MNGIQKNNIWEGREISKLIKFNNEEKAREEGNNNYKKFKVAGKCFLWCRLLVGETKGEKFKTQKKKENMSGSSEEIEEKGSKAQEKGLP